VSITEFELTPTWTSEQAIYVHNSLNVPLERGLLAKTQVCFMFESINLIVEIILQETRISICGVCADLGTQVF